MELRCCLIRQIICFCKCNNYIIFNFYRFIAILVEYNYAFTPTLQNRFWNIFEACDRQHIWNSQIDRSSATIFYNITQFDTVFVQNLHSKSRNCGQVNLSTSFFIIVQYIAILIYGEQSSIKPFRHINFYIWRATVTALQRDCNFVPILRNRQCIGYTCRNVIRMWITIFVNDN